MNSGEIVVRPSVNSLGGIQPGNNLSFKECEDLLQATGRKEASLILLLVSRRGLGSSQKNNAHLQPRIPNADPQTA